MNGEQQILCRILEESKDGQDDIPWCDREWDQMKIYAYTAACFALQHHKNHKNRELLVRILRCFCDSESGEVQYELVDACEAYCDNPYEDDVFVSEVVNAAPEMLKKSAFWFGNTMFRSLLSPHEVGWTFFIQTFKTLNKNEQQVIVDYLTYCHENDTDDDDYWFVLNDCLKASEIEKGDSQFFHKYINPYSY